MNYINQIRGFWTSHEEHSFSTTEIALYFHLLEVCNICQWKNPFKRNNQRIQADLGLSFNTLKNARNKLKTCGLIEVNTQNGNPNTTYTLSNFDEVFTRLERGSHEVDAEVLPTKDKQNKTKLNIFTYVNSDGSIAKVDYERFLSYFNSKTNGAFGVVRSLNETRKKHIRARVKEHEVNGFVEMLDKAIASNFLRGENQKSWSATLDWMINQSNFQKIIEGNYDNRNNRSGGSYTDAELAESIKQGIARGIAENS